MRRAKAIQDDIRREMLRRLYVAYFVDDDYLLVRPILQEHGWDEPLFWRTLDAMGREGLAELKDSGPSYEVRPHGVLTAEQGGIAPAELAATNKRLRTRILVKYAEAHDDPHYEYGISCRQVLNSIDLDADPERALLMPNHEFLFAVDQLEHPGSAGDFRITPQALDAVHEWRRDTELLRRFEALSETDDPQGRGRAFQALMGEFATDAGWPAEESVLAPGEEIDLILSRDDVFYCVECRWCKDPVGTKDIRDFAGKLRKRSGVPGLFISMSGFASDAVHEVEATTGETPVLLFGPKDVSSLFGRARSFQDQLTTKRKALLMRRKAEWE